MEYLASLWLMVGRAKKGSHAVFSIRVRVRCGIVSPGSWLVLMPSAPSSKWPKHLGQEFLHRQCLLSGRGERKKVKGRKDGGGGGKGEKERSMVSWLLHMN